MDFITACHRYRLLDVRPGFMSKAELKWLYETAAGMDRDECVVELGTLHGRSACTILAGLLARNGRLTCVDTFDGSSSTLAPSRDAEVSIRALRETISSRGLPPPRILVGRAQSSDILAEVPDGSVHWLFIDADHSYEGTRSEIELWKPKLAPHGVMSGHDIDHEGVSRAVQDCHPGAAWDWLVGSIWVAK